MCNVSGIVFAVVNIEKTEIEGKRILEVGAIDVNGSIRPILERFQPAEYIGVDLIEGKGVDRICRVEDLVTEFGPNSFDFVVASELLEHVRDWRSAVSNLKNVCKPNGIIFITTRSPGFKYHGFPDDYWRYDEVDLRKIFAEFKVLALERDPIAPGIFFKGMKPAEFEEIDLSDYSLFSVLLSEKTAKIDNETLIKLTRCFSRKKRIRKKILRAVQRILFPAGS
jgi:SAM-dependent methyltransferase